MWGIDDAIAVEITGTFYLVLANPDGSLDPDRAIHQATGAQRDQ
jgi:hypothetical protein